MRTKEALVTIIYTENGETQYFPLPEPTAYSGTTSSLIDSGTSVSGQLLGTIIRNDMAQISLSWNYLEAEVWAKINQRFKAQYINKIRFFDQTAGDWILRDMYINDRSAGMWRRDPDSGKVLGWTGCSLQLTEV